MHNACDLLRSTRTSYARHDGTDLARVLVAWRTQLEQTNGIGMVYRFRDRFE